MKTLATNLATFAFLVITLSASAQSTVSKINEVRVETNYEDGLMNIEWNTQKEVNSSYFLVQKSSDNVHFTAVKMVPASGNSNFTRHYQYSEIEISTGEVYYRVTMVTMNGQEIASAAIPVILINTGNLAIK